MSAVKSFKPIQNFEGLAPVIKVICLELRERLITAYEQFQIYPTGLILHFNVLFYWNNIIKIGK